MPKIQEAWTQIPQNLGYQDNVAIVFVHVSIYNIHKNPQRFSDVLYYSRKKKNKIKP